jgi:hypothetical protein
MPVQFITENPATAAFNEGVKNFQQQQLNDVNIEGKLLDNTEKAAGAPTRLRNLQATTSTNESAADVAYRTRDAKVSHEKSTAAHSAADAAVAQGTVGSRISQSGSAAASAAANARTAGAGATVAEGTVDSRIQQQDAAARSATAGADVAVQTVPIQVEAAKTGLRSQKANAVQSEMAGFYKSIELLNAGRVDEAREAARQSGSELPEAVVQSADVRNALTTASKHAQEIYPNRPKDQQMYIQGYIKAMADRMAHGGPATDPTAAASVPGAPEPQETSAQSRYSMYTGRGQDPNDPTKTVDGTYTFDSTTGEKTFEPGVSVSRPGGGTHAAGGGNSVYQQKLTAYRTLYPNDEAGALAYASGRKQLSDAELNRAAVSLAGREFATSVMAPDKKAAAINQRAAQISQQLRQGFSGGPVPSAAAPAVPSTAPATVQPPAQRPPPDLRGAGTQAQPLEATSQAHIDWFRQSAPPGTVLRANGQLYVK